MVYGTYNYSIHGVYKPSYIWGGPHCIYCLKSFRWKSKLRAHIQVWGENTRSLSLAKNPPCLWLMKKQLFWSNIGKSEEKLKIRKTGRPTFWGEPKIPQVLWKTPASGRDAFSAARLTESPTPSSPRLWRKITPTPMWGRGVVWYPPVN